MFPINLQSLAGFSSEQQKFAGRAMDKFRSAMNSDTLKQKIIGFICSLGHRFENNLGPTNQHVYEKLMTGSETNKAEANFAADLFWVLKKKNKPLFSRNPAIGFGLPGSKEITTYTWWFKNVSESDYAGHIAHEWSHKVGV